MNHVLHFLYTSDLHFEKEKGDVLEFRTALVRKERIVQKIRIKLVLVESIFSKERIKLALEKAQKLYENLRINGLKVSLYKIHE